MLTISPCCCRSAGRRHARRAALAVPAAAMLVVLLSLCRPPPCSSCCSRCAGRRHARHAALAVPATATLAVPLWPGSPECCPPVAHAAAMLTISPCCCRCACREYPPCCARCATRRYARRAALAVPAAAMLLSLSPLLLRSPCRCGRAHQNAARRSPMPPPCSPFRQAAVAVLAVNARRAALAVPAATMLVVLLSLCRPPPCSPCCSRCPRYCYARRATVAGLTEMLPDGRPCRRHAHHFARLLSLYLP
ncbi:hypothetical protein PF003_g1091 [Phytophthora fragariae]|nr:hypothetical protein PF003_g1091 [Phytophthora fragariae]